jgi:large subunit ribosomal protein L10
MLEGKKVQQYKLDAVAALKEKFQEVDDYIFTDYRGLTVEQITELRNKLRETNAEYKVIKNRFAKIAFKELKYDDLGDILIGPTAVALPREEAGPVAKILMQLSKDMPLEIKGGLMGGTVYDKGQVEDFSRLPTRKELISMLMSTMNAPLQNMVYVLNGVTEKLVRTLQAVADQKQE